MEKIVGLKEQGYSEAGQDPLAPIDFEDAIDNYDKVLEIVGELAGEVLEANAESVDHEGPHIIDNAIVYAEGTQKITKP